MPESLPYTAPTPTGGGVLCCCGSGTDDPYGPYTGSSECTFCNPAPACYAALFGVIGPCAPCFASPIPMPFASRGPGLIFDPCCINYASEDNPLPGCTWLANGQPMRIQKVALQACPTGANLSIIFGRNGAFFDRHYGLTGQWDCFGTNTMTLIEENNEDDVQYQIGATGCNFPSTITVAPC